MQSLDASLLSSNTANVYHNNHPLCAQHVESYLHNLDDLVATAIPEEWI